MQQYSINRPCRRGLLLDYITDAKLRLFLQVFIFIPVGKPARACPWRRNLQYELCTKNLSE
jgi:hypothetical protein